MLSKARKRIQAAQRAGIEATNAIVNDVEHFQDIIRRSEEKLVKLQRDLLVLQEGEKDRIEETASKATGPDGESDIEKIERLENFISESEIATEAHIVMLMATVNDSFNSHQNIIHDAFAAFAALKAGSTESLNIQQAAEADLGTNITETEEILGSAREHLQKRRMMS